MLEEENMDLFTLSKLISFSGDISRRLVAFSGKIDEAPTSIKSMGYEIRSASDVLAELHSVLRNQQNERISSFSQSAIEDIAESVEKCDEIIYEVARGVLVAHERMTKMPVIDGLVVVSIAERVKMPLFQLRLYSLVSELSAAKMDMVLQLLVLQIRSERFYGKKVESVLFASLSRDQREEIIAHLWQNKTLRNPEHIGVGGLPLRPMMRAGNGRSKTMPYQRSTGSFNTETDSSDDDCPAIASRGRGRGLFKRFADRFSRSKSRAGSESPSQSSMRNDSAHRSGMSSRTNSHIGRAPSISARSTSDLSNTSSANHSNSSTNSKATSFSSFHTDPRLQKRMSLLSMTNPTLQAHADNVPRVTKRILLQHGPTMSAKRGIEQEWEKYRTLKEWAQDHNAEEIRLGHQLLLGQLLSKTDVQGHDALPANVTVEMLVTRWTTVPRRDTIASSSPNLPTLQKFGQKPVEGDPSAIPQVPVIPPEMDLRLRRDRVPERFDSGSRLQHEEVAPTIGVRREQSVPALYRRQMTV